MTRSTYALDNAQKGSDESLSWLAQVLDLTTKTMLQPLIPIGGRCLELGAGTGTIAGWMADRAGSAGNVVAVDLDVRHLQYLTAHHGVRVVQRDLRTGLSLSDLGIEAPDVAHARCLFAHLHNREELLVDVVDLLRPGGWLVIEDMGGVNVAGQVLDSPYEDTADLYAMYQTALVKMFRTGGNDPTWAASTYGAMVAAGLQNVCTTTMARSWNGGTAGCLLPARLSAQVEDKLVRHGVTASQLAELRRQLEDPRVAIQGNLTWSTIGQKPVEG